jgi:hypothetical protein
MYLFLIELIFSIDIKASCNKITFNILKWCKSKYCPDGNAVISWENLKNNHEPVSSPSMVKLDKKFRDSSLNKGHDSEVWITDLEYFRVRFDDMGSSISENQFMIHVLNSLTSEYDLQLALLEKRVGDRDRLLTVEKIRADFSLLFERLHAKSTKTEESEELKVQALFRGQFKGKCRNCERIGHMSFQCKNRWRHNGGNNGSTTGRNYCSYCLKPAHVRKICFKLKKKKSLYGHNQTSNNINNNRDRENYDLQNVVFAATSKSEDFTQGVWIFDSRTCGYYRNYSKAVFNFEEFKESITVGNGKSMMATKVKVWNTGLLKFMALDTHYSPWNQVYSKILDMVVQYQQSLEEWL